jgi:hypothetical protein
MEGMDYDEETVSHVQVVVISRRLMTDYISSYISFIPKHVLEVYMALLSQVPPFPLHF